MWTKKFDGTNRHGGRQYNARPGSRLYFSSTDDPFVSYQWKIEVAGVTLAHFEEVSGLTVQTEVVKYREGGVNDYEHMLLGQTTYGNIMLKHGVSANMALFSWKDDASKGRACRKNGSIVLLDGTTNELARWNFARGWPCKWTGPVLAGKSSLSIETIEIAHEGLTREL